MHAALLVPSCRQRPRTRADAVALWCRRFYDRAGFNVKETIAGYYQKIEPADAYVLEKKLEHKATEATEEAKAE